MSDGARQMYVGSRADGRTGRRADRSNRHRYRLLAADLDRRFVLNTQFQHQRMSEQDTGGRAKALPQHLAALLEASDEASKQTAWSRFLNAHSRIILHTAKSLGSGYDPIMDRYTYVLEQLRRDDFRRLRTFAAAGRGSFTTWLMVVARRLCLDHHRERYGRRRASGNPGVADRMVRRRLIDLLAEELDVAQLGNPAGTNPETELRAKELAAAFSAVMSELDARDRLLLTLRFEDDLSAREIADVIDFKTLFHVYRRIDTVLAEVRHALERRGVYGTAP